MLQEFWYFDLSILHNLIVQNYFSDQYPTKKFLEFSLDLKLLDFSTKPFFAYA